MNLINFIAREQLPVFISKKARRRDIDVLRRVFQLIFQIFNNIETLFFEIIQRVLICSVFADFKVEVGSGCCARIAHVRYKAAFVNFVTDL